MESVTGPLKLLEMVVHGRQQSTPPEEATSDTVLAALDWSEDDSGQELVERAEAVEAANRDGAAAE
jgi:hypothetical protein